jgi:hypothetical protein
MIPGAGTILTGAYSHPQVVKGLAAGVLRSPIQAAGGIADTVGDVAHAVGGARADPRNYEGRISSSGVSFRYAPTTDTYSGFGADISHLSHVGNETANQLAANTAAIAIGYGAGAGALRAVGAAPKIEAALAAFNSPVARTAAGLAARATGAAASDAIVLDPETERFSNLLQNLGVHTQFTDWLAHDDKEGRLEGRFKNAVEGLGLGAATDGLLQAGSYWRARLRGDHATADAIQAELAAKHDGEVPDYAIEEHPGPPPPPEKGHEPGFVGGWEESPTGAVRPVYEEDPLKGAAPDQAAKAEDDAAQATAQGATEGETPASPLPEGAGSTGGSVKPMDPQAMRRAMGDGEAGAADPTVTFTAKRTPTDEPRVVGSIDRTSIDALASDVRFWRGEAAHEGDPRILDVTRDQETGQAHGEFRLGNLGGSQQNVAPLLRAMVDRIPETAPRSDAQLMQDAARASAEIGEDPAALLEAARLISGKLADADTAMATIRSVWVRAEKDLDTLPDINWETASEADVEQAAQRIHNMMLISSHVQEAKAGLGRGLRVNQLPDADSYLNTVRKADKAPDPTTTGVQGPLPRTRQELQDWFDLWQSTKGEPELRAALLEGALTRLVPTAGHYLRSAFANFFTASILSAPKTLLLNLVGPAAMSVIRNVERQSGAMVAAVNPFLTAEERAGARATARATAPAYLQTFGDIADTMRWAWKAAERNKTIIGGGQTIDSQAAFGPWTENLIEAARPGETSLAEAQAYALGNAINLWPRAVQRINNGFDEFSKRLAYLGEVRVRALTEGLQQGLSGDDLRALVKQRLQASVNEVGHATEDDVLREAERTTLTYKTGEQGGLLRKGYDYINTIRRDIPESRYILPVLGVPANTLGEALRRLPIAGIPGVNQVLFKRTADELAGVYGPVLQADAHGRMITGASFLLGGVMLNRMGLLTGAGPQDPTDRKVWLMEHQPYSIRIGDQWVRYDKYDVIGGLLSIPSTISDTTIYIREDKGYGDLLMSGVGALAQWFKDRAALRGAAGLLALGDDPTSSATGVANRTVGSILQGFIPNAIQAPVTQAVDPYQRMRRGWDDYLKAAIPGLSSTLPPVRNVLGEPVQRPANSVGEGVFPVTIAPAVTFKQDPVIDEIDRLYQVTGYGAGADPKALGYGFFNPKDIVLENGQTMYDAFMQSRQHLRIDGLTLRQSLGRLFNSPEYNQAVDGDPQAKETSRGDAIRGYMVQQVFNHYNKAIKAELAEASPTANKWLTAAAAKQRDDAYLRDVSAQDLVDNPNYYQSHGIDGALYSSKVREGATGELLTALRRR